MRLNSDAVVATEKAIFTGELSAFTYMTGLRKQRGQTLGELDPYALEDIDMMLTTFRVFEDVPAHLIKYIGVTHRDMLRSALAATEPSVNIYPSAFGITPTLKNESAASASSLDKRADAEGIAPVLRNEDISAVGHVPNKASGAYMRLLSGGEGACALGINALPDAHKTVLLSSDISIEITTTTDET